MENGPPQWLPDGWTLFRGFSGLYFANWGEIGKKLKRPIFLFDQTRRRRGLTNWCRYAFQAQLTGLVALRRYGLFVLEYGFSGHPHSIDVQQLSRVDDKLRQWTLHWELLESGRYLLPVVEKVWSGVTYTFRFQIYNNSQEQSHCYNLWTFSRKGTFYIRHEVHFHWGSPRSQQ